MGDLGHRKQVLLDMVQVVALDNHVVEEGSLDHEPLGGLEVDRGRRI